MKISIIKTVQSALFITIGMILPILFHAFGLGKEFLPMHLPVIIGAIMLGWKMGLIIGLLTPLMSSLFTGMPPMMPPVAVAMMIELAILGALSGCLYPLFRENIIATLLTALLAGRAVWGIIGYFMLPLLGIRGVSIFYPLAAGLITSLPGLLIQITLIPIIVSALKKKRK